MSVFSLSGSAAKPSAYSCTTAASSTRSSRYLRSRRRGGWPLAWRRHSPRFSAGREQGRSHQKAARRKDEGRTDR